MTDPELRRLATAARRDHTKRRFRCDWSEAITVPDEPERAYIEAASPERILALFARIATLEAALSAERIAQAAHASHNCLYTPSGVRRCSEGWHRVHAATLRAALLAEVDHD